MLDKSKLPTIKSGSVNQPKRISSGMPQAPKIQGPPGKQGKPGPPGLAIQGPPGKPGRDGKDGKPGPPGKDGRNGRDGFNGRDGKDGLNGRDGIDGKDGKDGKDGAPGRTVTSVGPGVARGGTTGQYLRKRSNKQYDTYWGEAPGGGGSTSWGDILGTLSDQADLQAALDAKADTGHTHTASNITDFNGSVDARITAQKGANDGIAPLDGSGKIASSYLPAIAISESFPVASEAAQLALTAEKGDIAIRSDLNQNYIHNGGTAGTMADWNLLLTPTDNVLSVNGNTGVVTLTKSDVGLSNVENTALSTWAGTSNITTLGTITTGVWNGTAIGVSYINATGTPSSTTFLRGDGQWATPAGGGGGVTPSMFYALGSGSANLGTTLGTVPLATASKSDTGFSLASNQVTIGSELDGKWAIVTWAVAGSGATNRVEIRSELQVNSVRVKGSSNYSARNTTQAQGGVQGFHIMQLSDGDVIRIQALRDGSTANLIADETHLSIVTLS